MARNPLPTISVLAFLLAVILSATTRGQPPRVNYLHNSNMPPGYVGRQQLLRGPGMAGYFQPVEISVPEGVHVSVMVDGQFDASRPGPVLCGMQIGYVYPIKVTNIPLLEGAEVFPTIELVNRLCPPQGKQLRFPVPIELTREEIEFAIEGKFVTRVIYLEDPDNALPQRDDPKHQRVVDVGLREDPLHVADRYGRPMAILRMGSRVPDEASESLPGFAAAPLQVYPPQPKHEVLPEAGRAIERFGKDVPRESLEPPVAKP